MARKDKGGKKAAAKKQEKQKKAAKKSAGKADLQDMAVAAEAKGVTTSVQTADAPTSAELPKASKPDKKKGEEKAVKPKAVKTGRGASPAEVAAGVVAMLREKAPEETIWKKWFSSKLVSIEGQMGQAWHGMKAVKSKAQWWYSTHRVHSMEIDGPFVGATGFGVRYTIDAEAITTGERIKGDELAFYTVRNGKVIQEEFMGRSMETPAAPAPPAKPTA